MFNQYKLFKVLLLSTFFLLSFSSSPGVQAEVFDAVDAGGSDSDYITCFEATQTSNPFGITGSEWEKNHGNECVIIADVNAKIEAGILKRRLPLLAVFKIIDTLEAARCYHPSGGFIVTDRCLEVLAKANQAESKEDIQIHYRATGKKPIGKSECEQLEKDLSSGGGAFIAVFYNEFHGHAVGVVEADCDRSKDPALAFLELRDPNDPGKTIFATLNLESGSISTEDPGSYLHGTIARMSYSFGRS